MLMLHSFISVLFFPPEFFEVSFRFVFLLFQVWIYSSMRFMVHFLRVISRSIKSSLKTKSFPIAGDTVSTLAGYIEFNVNLRHPYYLV